MAMLITNTGKRVFLSANRATYYWLLLNGETEPRNDKEKQLMKTISRVYLSRQNAPESYLRQHRHLFYEPEKVVEKQKVAIRLPYKD